MLSLMNAHQEMLASLDESKSRIFEIEASIDKLTTERLNLAKVQLATEQRMLLQNDELDVLSADLKALQPTLLEHRERLNEKRKRIKQA